jgi:uncharacterized protein YjiS (DUF1127 family)
MSLVPTVGAESEIRQTERRVRAASLLASAGSALAIAGRWYRRGRNRHELSQLTDEQLRDVGLDPQEIRSEALKPFWKA